MNASHLAWASQHDWFVSIGRDQDGNYIIARNSMTGGFKYFYDIEALRAWAGY